MVFAERLAGKLKNDKMVVNERRVYLMRFAKRILCVVSAFVLTLMWGGSVMATELASPTLDLLYSNGVYYYNPQGGGTSCYSNTLNGDTVMAKVVNYLQGNNPTGFVMSDNGIAGVLANFQGESGFNPFRFQGDVQSGPGYGIAQFTPQSKILDQLISDSRTANFYNTYYDIKYTRYNPETGFPKESVPMDVIDAWLAVQLDFFFGASSEFETTKVGNYRNLGGTMGLSYIGSSMTVHEAMDAAKSPEDATRIFVWIMERPGDKERAANDRSTHAQEWLNYAKRAGTGGRSVTSSTAVDGSQVTMIGDSITNGARSQLEQALPGVDIYAQDSKQFYEGTADNPGGIEILQDLVDEGKLRQTLVYALGTNNSELTSKQAQEVVNLAGSSRKVIFVTNWTKKDDYTANNNVLEEMRNRNGNVSIADWRSVIESRADTDLLDDGIHPNDEGKKLFAEIIANTVSTSGRKLDACVLGMVEGGMSQAQAQKLADYYNSDKVNADYWSLPFGKENCVSFSAFFIQRFTSVGRVSRAWGDGKEVAQRLAANEGLPMGIDPRPYAVFSVTSGSTICEDGFPCGHTGVVVGVEGDTIITVEAAYPNTLAYVSTRNISYFVNTKYKNPFVYLDSILNQSELESILK